MRAILKKACHGILYYYGTHVTLDVYCNLGLNR